MNMRLQQYRFIDSKAGILSTAATHLLASVILFMEQSDSILSAGRGLLCLGVALALFVLHQIYDWLQLEKNLFIITVYCGIILFEYAQFGMPQPVMVMASGYTKGFMMAFFIQMLPWIYVGLRISSIYFLLKTTLEAKKLKLLQA